MQEIEIHIGERKNLLVVSRETLKRINDFNFKKPGSTPKKTWSIKEIEEIFDLDKKLVDRDLAKKFKTSLPAINHIRRKFKMVREIFEIKNQKGNKTKIVAYSMKSEKLLREELASLTK
ncbi:MAG: hypothetical protein IPG24_09360 [Leptospiraceae bacterium]|nr:hypothetical protein [Leptospiraceae bacterium]